MAARTRRTLIAVAVLLLALLVIWLLPQPAPSIDASFPYGELRIGVDASNPPFAVATADDLFGLEIDLGLALGEELDLPVRFVNLSFDGLYDALKTDQVDILIATLTIEAQRSPDVLYTHHYFNAGLVLVSSEDNPISDMDQLPGHVLAYEFGSEADTLARRWLRRIAPFETRAYELPDHALSALQLSLADAALVDAISARLYLREHEWQAHISYVTNNWYPIAVPADEVARWQFIDKALQRLSDNGALDAIMSRWL